MALRSLRLAIRQLTGLPGERVIVLTSPGFFVQTPEAISDREQLLKIAAKAGVTISALNSCGLYTNEPDAAGDIEPNQLWAEYPRRSAQIAEGILQDLTQGTGGIYIHNNDGFRAAFDRLATPPGYSYVLGF